VAIVVDRNLLARVNTLREVFADHERRQGPISRLTLQ